MYPRLYKTIPWRIFFYLILFPVVYLLIFAPCTGLTAIIHGAILFSEFIFFDLYPSVLVGIILGW